MPTVSARPDGAARWPSRAVSRPGTAARPVAAGSMLDYYLVRPDNPDFAGPAGILVEEFVLDRDYSAVRLDSTGWTAGGSRWRGASTFSRGVRADAALRDRVVGANRQEVEFVYRHLGGGELPGEEVLRGHFDDGIRLPASAPLRLSPGRATPGFTETRLYRVLFTAGLDPDALTGLLGTWRMRPGQGGSSVLTGVVGTARRRVGADAFTWELRRIGAGAAWCLDLTADLAGDRDDAIGPLLRELATAARMAGLIPVTIERLR
ncbi:hypothetical protein [Plantactinospora sp. BB1]|uniref:hypothetical protein n=1 Tax=Plantactinospora sp. BB1 TaxID=2071627 RepID=UPI00131EF781|nr:hypothetical protein [Plantactinospora sp. BB1]